MVQLVASCCQPWLDLDLGPHLPSHSLPTPTSASVTWSWRTSHSRPSWRRGKAQSPQRATSSLPGSMEQTSCELSHLSKRAHKFRAGLTQMHAESPQVKRCHSSCHPLCGCHAVTLDAWQRSPRPCMHNKLLLECTRPCGAPLRCAAHPFMALLSGVTAQSSSLQAAFGLIVQGCTAESAPTTVSTARVSPCRRPLSP